MEKKIEMPVKKSTLILTFNNAHVRNEYQLQNFLSQSRDISQTHFINTATTVYITRVLFSFLHSTYFHI